MRQTGVNFELDTMNLPRQYGVINLHLIFAQRMLDSKRYFGNVGDVIVILGYVLVSKIIREHFRKSPCTLYTASKVGRQIKNIGIYTLTDI
jgi:hypothetical protein